MLVYRYLLMHLKSQLEYRSSFILSFIAQIIPITLSASMVFVLMNKFNFSNKYDTYEVMLGIAIVQFGFSFAECFFRGFDKFSNIIKKGMLDLMLIKPRNIYIQVFGSEIAFPKISRIIGSIVLFIISINKINIVLNIWKVLLLIGLLFFSTLIYISLYILASSLCFKTTEALEVTNIFTDGSREFGQYPMDIFKKEVLIIFTFLIPIACVNYYPLRYILGYSKSILYLISPLFTIVLFVIAILTFNKCLSHYASTGS